jgi:hypothetical protein
VRASRAVVACVAISVLGTKRSVFPCPRSCSCQLRQAQPPKAACACSERQPENRSGRRRELTAWDSRMCSTPPRATPLPAQQHTWRNALAKRGATRLARSQGGCHVIAHWASWRPFPSRLHAPSRAHAPENTHASPAAACCAPVWWWSCAASWHTRGSPQPSWCCC